MPAPLTIVGSVVAGKTPSPDPTVEVKAPASPGPDLAAQAQPGQQELKTTTVVAMDAKPAEHVAILSVQSKAQALVVKGYDGGTMNLDLTYEGAPRVGPDSEATALQVWRNWKDAWNDNPELNAWIQKLRTDHKDKLCLLIQDSSGEVVPWEMLPVSATDPVQLAANEIEYLGAVVLTVREHPASPDKPPPKVEFKSTRVDGQLVSYVLKELFVDPKLSAPDKKTADKAHEIINEQTTKDYPDIGTLLDHLKNKDLPEVALAYMLCHGEIDKDDVGVSYLGSNKAGGAHVTYDALLGMPLKLVTKSKSVMFINSCNAGGIGGKKPGSPNRAKGFAGVFLRQGATAVIGALDRVLLQHATVFAQDLVTRALPQKDQPAMALAEIIRELRKQAVSTLPKEGETPDEDNLRSWYQVFLYVYYGNPLVTLKVVKS